VLDALLRACLLSVSPEDVGYLERLRSRRCPGVFHPDLAVFAVLLFPAFDPILINDLCASFVLGLYHTDYTFWFADLRDIRGERKVMYDIETITAAGRDTTSLDVL
jgi:hypothetical protein